MQIKYQLQSLRRAIDPRTQMVLLEMPNGCISTVKEVMLMHQRIIRQTLLVLYFLLSYNGVQGRTKLSKQEDLELEEQLKLLNKPSVKIIKSRHGDTYNCVDFYKQPAFNHPLLKNHNFHPEMKPTLARSKENSSTSATNWASRIWSKDGGCPFGTVPIRRLTKEDLVRQRNMPPPEDVTYNTKLTTINNKSESNGRYITSKDYKVAMVHIPESPNNKFAGAGMSTSIYNPHVIGKQHSASRLKVQNGPDIVQVGWRVDPTLYGDSKTRLFAHFQAGNTHCFNTLCPGFILVNQAIPLDMVFDEISHRGDRPVEFRMYIDRDLINGNWWLILGKNEEQIGYWPPKIFTRLANFGNNVEWGGVAYSPPGVPKPPMGSSFFPIESTGSGGYCRRLIVLDDKGKTIDVDKTIVHVDDPNLYRVSDHPHMLPGEFQHFVFFGGPGESK